MATPPSAAPVGLKREKSSDGEDAGGLGLAKAEEKTGQKILRRMGSFGFGRGGVEVDAMVSSSSLHTHLRSANLHGGSFS